ncbi:ROK family protein [Ruminococcus sp. OA3]|uniref:ROK family protein n=1 Tax=Ruminococcus sp. OA3 TaxID=2914164 RepID=UPI001F0511B5|nr:ROK family protein [Ruminococcus sp. OA3]MCH1981920.1 ROK family protein [Ruminococcus sp. OA3]
MVSWSTPDLKLYNKELIRKEIQNNETCRKSQIAQLTSLSIGTCNTAINEMLRDNEIIKVDQEELIMGRPADRFCYNKDYFHVMGMYLSGEHRCNLIEYAVADALGNENIHESLETEVITYEVIEKIVDEMLTADPLIRSLSIGIPGITSSGVVERCDISTIVGVDLEGQLRRKFHIDVEVRNDMDFIAYGAYHTIYNGSANMAAVFFPSESEGTVGCGFVVNGKVLRGYTKFSGEVSYILEGFGISRKQQAKYWGDRDIFLVYAAQIVLIIIATLDPEEIVLIGNGIHQDEVPVISEFCSKIVSDSHIPKIIATSDYANNYIKGLVRASINRISFPISEPL